MHWCFHPLFISSTLMKKNHSNRTLEAALTNLNTSTQSLIRTIHICLLLIWNTAMEASPCWRGSCTSLTKLINFKLSTTEASLSQVYWYNSGKASLRLWSQHHIYVMPKFYTSLTCDKWRELSHPLLMFFHKQAPSGHCLVKPMYPIYNHNSSPACFAIRLLVP